MVEGRPLKIKTDHNSLTFAFDHKPEKASSRQLRQLDFISQFLTDIVFIAGENNVTADALSRISEIEMTVLFTTEDLSDAQKYDEELQDLLKSNSSLKMRKLMMTNSDTYLYCDVSTDEIRSNIPKNLRRKIFDLTHGLSHSSGRVTQKLIIRPLTMDISNISKISSHPQTLFRRMLHSKINKVQIMHLYKIFTSLLLA